MYRSTSATGTFTKLNAALLDGPTYADTAAPQGVPSYYQVTAVDASGNESARVAMVNATRPDTTAAGSGDRRDRDRFRDRYHGQVDGLTATDLAGYNVYRSATATGPTPR